MVILKNSIKFFILTGLLILSASIPASAQDMTLTKFQSDITIPEDSCIVVKEIIEVEFNRPKRGIYRDIPYIYKDDLGRKIKTPFKVVGVTDENGKSWKYKTKRANGYINIRIGDPKIFVTGKKTYIINYRVDNAILFFPDHDELYWNVTGNGWQAPIKNVSANITLSSKKETKEKWASCYTGSFGSRESNCGYKPSGNSINFTSRDLRHYEGFTIAYGWDKGITQPPSIYKRLLWVIRDNWIFLLPVISFLMMFFLWFFGGRDPRVRDVIAVQYGPPNYKEQTLNPAEVGTLIDETMNMRDITASIVGLAVKGFLKIEETKKKGLIFDSSNYVLTKVKDPDTSLTGFEKELMKNIFGSKETVPVSSLNNRFYTHIPTLKDLLYKDLISKGYFKNEPDDVRRGYAIAGFILLILGFILGINLADSLGARSVLAGILVGIPVLGFAKHMPAKTTSGAKALADIKGFEEFLNRAEKDRLQRMQDEHLFEKFLPYAMALNVADNWADAFEGIYQSAPEWYSSSGGFKRFSTGSFVSNLNGALTSVSSAMASAPRSSSGGGGGGFSHGGGSSGGGFGGGGGGSW